MPAAEDCPACGFSGPLAFVESHRDRIAGKTYRVLACPACEVVSSYPREAVGADWYAKASPIRGLERCSKPDQDWRFKQFFSERLPAGKILDVGCGDGGFLGLAARTGFKPSGFDYDERVVAQGRARGLSDLRAMEFSAFCRTRAKAEFDVITLFDVLEHTPEPARFLGELKRLLKPKGHLVVTLPNALRPIPWGREEHDFPPHHFTRWTPRALRRFLETQNFAVLRQEAGTLKLRYISDNVFFARVMPGLLALARLVLFGRKASPQTTITDLYAKGGAKAGALSDKRNRQRLVNAALACFEVVFFPAAVLLKLKYTARRAPSGDCLYTLARYNG